MQEGETDEPTKGQYSERHSFGDDSHSLYYDVYDSAVFDCLSRLAGLLPHFSNAVEEHGEYRPTEITALRRSAVLILQCIF